MPQAHSGAKSGIEPLQKCPTGIKGLDEITIGGLPRGRTSLICGGPGCGKTLLGLEFLVRGALQYDEHGVFVSFEEKGDELARNVASLGYDLSSLISEGRLVVDWVEVERGAIEETGEYDLEGLFVRLGYVIDTVGAKRVVLDTIESLFSGFSNEGLLRAELRRLFRWLKARGVTAVITGEQGQGQLTRYGLEEYVADCVISLSHIAERQIVTRRLRVVKYRGSFHGTNEYPFLIDDQGFSVMPITSLGLDHAVSLHRVPSGISRLDTMLGGEGYFEGSSILVSGSAGTGKSSVAAHFVDAACRRGERGLYFAFEESQSQIVRNMRSIGIDLQQWVDKGLLRFHTTRPSLYGLEMHLVAMHRCVDCFDPKVVVVDPISNLVTTASEREVRAMFTRLLDYLKLRQITALCTDLTVMADERAHSDASISSLMDTWLLLRNLEAMGERNRGLYILKSRGMEHSNQIREFVMSRDGVQLRDVYLGTGVVLTGAARLAQEARDAAENEARKQKIERAQRRFERNKRVTDAQITALRAEHDLESEELQRLMDSEKASREQLAHGALAIARARRADQVEEPLIPTRLDGAAP